MRSLAAALLVGLVCVAPAAAATSPWAKRANAVCRSWAPRQKAAFTGLKTPRTKADAFKYLRVARPLEAGLLADLRAIKAIRPAAAEKALAAAANDVRELDAAIAAYRASSTKRFSELFTSWANDNRATKAFDAAGAGDCS